VNQVALPVLRKPRLTQAVATLTRSVRVCNEAGQWQDIAIPAERALTVYLDKRELVTLMTLGAHPEWLVLGFLLNQRLIDAVEQIESVTVDWSLGAGEIGEPGVAAVRTHAGVVLPEQRSAERVVSTACGQGSVFGSLMAGVHDLQLPETCLTQAQLYAVVNTIRTQQSTYKAAGSVHGCALFQGDSLRLFVEDVGRHNAVDTLAGWMAMHNVTGEGHVLYTTGRLTSEMVIKAAQMGIAVLVSRSGITQMGLAVATHLGVCTIGRALHQRFLCYSAPERLLWQPQLLAR
jgi:FdhD protein